MKVKSKIPEKNQQIQVLISFHYRIYTNQQKKNAKIPPNR